MSKTMTVYIPATGDSTSQSQSRTITINNLRSVDGISVNTGTVNYTKTGNDVQINCSGGAVVRTQTTQDTMAATDYQSSSYNSFPSSIYYDAPPWSGTLYANGLSYVISGSYTPSDSKTATSSNAQAVYQQWKWVNNAVWVADGQPWNNAVSSKSYNDGVYSGTLYLQGVSGGNPPYPSGSGSTNGQTTITNDAGTASYSGTVTKPAVDTRVWRQDYAGTLYGATTTTYYYAYMVTLTYTDTVRLGTVNYKSPSGTISLPVYDLTMTDPILRIKLPNAIGCFELVATNDARASSVRVMTQKGLKAIAKN